MRCPLQVSKDAEIEKINQRMDGLVAKINEHRRRRAMLLGFAQDPVAFINALLPSQAKEVRQSLAQGPSFDVLRPSEAYRQQWAEEAVVNHLSKKAMQGAAGMLQRLPQQGSQVGGLAAIERILR